MMLITSTVLCILAVHVESMVRECKVTAGGFEYMGTTSRTKDGTACQPWSEQSPHEHTFTDPLQFPDRNIAAVGAACRNPDGASTPWCYTMNPQLRWAYCDIPTCSALPDCLETLSGMEYRGTQSVTRDNRPCKAWSRLTYRERQNLDESLLGADAGNFCRNPDRRNSGPWCFVDNQHHLAVDCGIPLCRPSMKCKRTKSGVEYAGPLSVSKSGRTCQRWSKQAPHEHHKTHRSMFPDDSVAEAANHCRNPDGFEGGPWCYTEDPDFRWETCNVPTCGECLSDEMGVDYAGVKNRSRNGIPCQRWSSQEPHAHVMVQPNMFPEQDELAVENYCRNPDRSPTGPWCYLDDRKIERETCGIPLCPVSDKGSTRRRAKHVLHIGVDGLRPSCIPDENDAPNMRGRLARAGTHTLTKARSVLPSLSAPGWSTTLCGAEPETTGVTGNSWEPPWFGHHADITPVTPPHMPFPCVFDVLKAQDPNIRTGMFYGWTFFDYIANIGHPGAVDKQYLYSYKTDGHFESDRNVLANAIPYLRDTLISSASSYTFVYFLSADCTAHAKGWCGTEYKQAVSGIDKQIGGLLDVIDDLNMEDDVLVMLSADHGGEDKDHYIPLDIDLNIPMFLRGPGIKEDHEFQMPVSNSDMVPTALHLMGLEGSPYWTGHVMKDAIQDE